jgi:hypothetical protein
LHIKKIIFLIFILSLNSFSNEKEVKTEETKTKEEESSLIDDSADAIDFGRKYVGDKFKFVMNEVDQFFAPEIYEDEVNRSYVRVLFDISKTKGEGLTNAFNFKFQAQFPHLSKGAKVVIQREGEEAARSLLEGDSATSQSGNDTAQESQPDGYSAAVRRFLIETEGRNLSYDLGMKLDVPLDPFAKIRYRELWDWTKFSIRFVQSNEYFRIDRLFNESSLYFDYALNDDHKISFRNSYYWAWSSDAENFNHNLNFYHSITEKMAIAWNISANAVIEDHAIFYNNYGLSTGYRTLLFKDWFFGEVSLGTNFPKEKEFKSTEYITFRMDMIF